MSAYSDLVIASSPNAYFRLGDAAGNPQDLSGKAHHFTANASLTYGVAGALASPETDKAITFGGAASQCNQATHADLDFAYNANFTIMFWDHHTATTAWLVMFAKMGAAGGYPYQIRHGGGGNGILVFQRSDGTYTPFVSPDAAYVDGNYHFFAARKSGGAGGTMQWMVDGVVQNATATDTTTGTTTNAYNVWLGARYDSSLWWNGTADELAIFPSALSWSTLEQMYVLGKLGTYPRGRPPVLPVTSMSMQTIQRVLQ